MKFRRAIQRYGTTPQPQTPFQRASQMWDERIGSARVQAANWRIMAFGALALSTGLSAALVWQSMQSRVVPYVVAVDRLGEPRAIAPADKDYHPTDPQIAWFLARFVTDVRSRSLDPVLMRQNWLQAYDWVTAHGATMLSDYARRANPFAGIGQTTASVEITSVVRASDKSFQVKWIETDYERGSLAGTSHWTAILTIALKPPVNADVLRDNPLGLYVDAIDWSRELEPAASAATQVTSSASPAVPSAGPALPAAMPARESDPAAMPASPSNASETGQ